MFRRLAYSILAFVLAWQTAHADSIITGAIPNTFTPGSTISSSQMNANFQYIINQVNANGAKNGTNSSITALTALSTPLTAAQGGSNIYTGGTATGTANAVVVATAVPSGFTLATGNTIAFYPAAHNTGATTLAVNGTTATNVFKQTPSGLVALTGGELVAGVWTAAVYDGTQYELVDTPVQNGGFGTQTSVVGAATTDLGAIGSHNAYITGGANITSFGSSATLGYPIYLIQVAVDTTIISSANLVLPSTATSTLFRALDQALLVYNGTGKWTVATIFPAQNKTSPVAASALSIKNNAVTPNTKIDVAAAEVVMDNTSGGTHYVENYGACTIDMTVVGFNGIDAGAIAANTWYYIYAISSGQFTGCLASTNVSAPTMPAGYLYKMRIGAMKTNSGAATLWPTYQKGATVRYTAALATAADRVAVSGAAGTCGATVTTTTATVWGTIVPSTASAASLQLTVNNSQAAVFQAPMAAASALTVPGVVSYNAGYDQREFTYIYNGVATINVCSQAASSINVNGWTDAVNAN